MQDVITREITINAGKEEVYDAVANPHKVVQWFPKAVEGTYVAGEQSVFVFGHGKVQIAVVEARPYEYFSYRWIPGGSDFIGDLKTMSTTLVEFRLAEKDGVTTVTMTESGFASLPVEVAENAFKQNSGGWEYMLGRFEKYMAQK